MRLFFGRPKRKMLTEEVICPNCGERTLVNLPAARERYGTTMICGCACRHCKRQICYWVCQESGKAGVIEGVPWLGE